MQIITNNMSETQEPKSLNKTHVYISGEFIGMVTNADIYGRVQAD